MEFSNPNDIKASFEKAGGEFLSPLSVFKEKLHAIKAFVFDWDGVFNDGFKKDNQGSPFSEPSSMGLNMLRFSYFLKHGKLPYVFIITGENNLPAIKLSEREHFTGVYLNVRNKLAALEHITTTYAIEANQVAFTFDDILDLGMAEKAGLRMVVRRKSNPLLDVFIAKNNLADYKTGAEGQEHAVREVSELIIGLNGNYGQTLHDRLNFSAVYKKYLDQRNSYSPQYFEGSTGAIGEYVRPE
ncbi:MAG: phosphatase [Cyclobacteriaceae bacterium]|nr:phosphatase [Cyclobacteriaceae bacterium]